MKVALAYGREALEAEVPPSARLVEAPPLRGTIDYRGAFDRALREPVDQLPLEAQWMIGERLQAAIVVPDETRWLPLREALEAVVACLPSWTPRPRLLVANGNHAPADPRRLGIGDDLLARFEVVNHDSRDSSQLVDLGRTSTGLGVRVNRALVEADLRVGIAAVRPHYFMGYSGGAKIFVPGVAGFETIVENHRKRAHPSCRLGNVEGNVTRAEIEEAAELVGYATTLNVVLNDRRELIGAFAGSAVAAHRAAVRACRPLVEVEAEPADVVVVSDALPVAINVYQALKLLGVAAPLLRPGGVAIVVAECPGGTGPVDAVNDVIYKPWLATLLPPGHRCVLVSGLPDAEVERTFFRPAPSVEAALAWARGHLGREGDVAVVPRAGLLVPRAAGARPGSERS